MKVLILSLVCFLMCLKTIDGACEDTENVVIISGADRLTCQEYTKLHPGACDPDLPQSSLGLDVCCGTCQSVDISCYDNNFILWNAPKDGTNGRTERFDTCQDLIRDHRGYCRGDNIVTLNGRQISTRDACCKSCRNTREDLCADKPVFITFNNRKWTCNDFIAKFPGYCKSLPGNTIPDTCCRACRSIDTRCLDSPFRVTYSHINVNSLPCSTAVSRWPGLCFYGDLPEGSPDGLKKACCASCKGVDLSCFNDPFFLWFPRRNDGSFITPARNCKQMGGLTSAFRKRACCNGWKGQNVHGAQVLVQKACCEQCENVSCD